MSLSIFSVEKINYPPERLADAHELIGSTFFDEHSDTQLAFKYWQTALTIRSMNGTDGDPLPKRPIYPKRESFRNMNEFNTLDELRAIMLDLDAVRIQSLLICERILGAYHKDTLFRLMYRGASYADALRFVVVYFLFIATTIIDVDDESLMFTLISSYQYCIDLWTRALEIRVEKDSVSIDY